MSLVAILTILEEEEFVPTTENAREDQLTSQEEQFTSQVFITWVTEVTSGQAIFDKLRNPWKVL